VGQAKPTSGCAQGDFGPFAHRSVMESRFCKAPAAASAEAVHRLFGFIKCNIAAEADTVLGEAANAEASLTDPIFLHVTAISGL